MSQTKRSLNLSKEELLPLFKRMLLSRLCEEKIREVYPQNEIKSPVHLGIGEEAIVMGVCHCLQNQGSFFGTYRNHNLFFALSENSDGFFAELYGKVTGVCKGKGGSMHMMDPASRLMGTSAVVATTIPVAVGAALANQYRGNDEIVVVFFGDGAIEEGVFWESLNFASLKKLRVLFVCEDNALAIHAHARDRQGFKSVGEAIEGFKCHRGESRGYDPMDVIGETQKIVAKMKSDPQPGFLRFEYFRFLEHVGINEDFNAGYRENPGADKLKQFDPIEIMKQHLLASGVTEQELVGLKNSIITKINSSVEAAKKAPFPAGEELMNDVLRA